VCDGDADCSDGLDEKDCDKKSCAEGRKKCADGIQCIDANTLCDRTKNCKDGSDEKDCKGVCMCACVCVHSKIIFAEIHT
jgi:hypothetical protein